MISLKCNVYLSEDSSGTLNSVEKVREFRERLEDVTEDNLRESNISSREAWARTRYIVFD